jgi:hypothetical protein
MRRLLAFAFLLALAPAASADIALPPGLKYVKPRVQFDGVEKYADHAFFLKFRSSPGNPFAAPPTYVQVKNAEPFTLEAARRIAGLELYALPAKDAEKLRADDPSYKWLDDKTPGVLRASLTPPSTVAPVTVKEAPVTPYRVAIKEGKLTAIKAEVEKKSEAPHEDRIRTAFAAGALALGLALTGLWFVRRKK